MHRSSISLYWGRCPSHYFITTYSYSGASGTFWSCNTFPAISVISIMRCVFDQDSLPLFWFKLKKTEESKSLFKWSMSPPINCFYFRTFFLRDVKKMKFPEYACIFLSFQIGTVDVVYTWKYGGPHIIITICANEMKLCVYNAYVL